MLPVALLAVAIPQTDAAQNVIQPSGVLSTSSQPTFSSGARSGTLLAQSITPGDTSTIISPEGNQIDITGGQTSGDGANLFHSFEQFGLSEQQTANFIANPQIQNVLGRVGGGSASYIDGILRVSNSDASLYLINPAGILFGPNAQLDLTGSFTAATADGIGFDGGWLDVFESGDYSQLVGNPTQFSFGAEEPGSVVNLGDLAVGENQNLVLLGGNLVNIGNVSAPSGSVTLAAVNGQQTVSLGAANGLLTMELTPFVADREISVLSLPELLTGGELVEGSELAIAPDGTVSLQGVILPEGTAAVTGAIDVSGQQTGEVNVLGEHVALLETTVEASSAQGGGSTIRIGGGYQGQDSVPNAEITYVSSGSSLDVSGGETGDGGSVIVWADDTTQFYGSVDAQGGTQSGDGGFVEISGKDQLVFRGDVQTTAAAGTTGTLLLDPTDIIIAAGTGDGDSNGSSSTFIGDTNALLGQILEDDFPGGVVTLFESELEGLAGDTNIILEATNDIVLNDLPDDQLTFTAGTGSIRFTADGDINLIDPDDTFITNGRDLSLRGDSLRIGSLLTEGGDITLDTLSGDVLLAQDTIFSTGAAQPGNITVFGSINSLGAPAALEIVAGDGDIEQTSFIGDTSAITTVTLSGSTIESLGPITAFNDVNIAAQERLSLGSFSDINSGGDVSLSSGEDFSSFRNTITSGGTITVTAGRDINIDRGSWIATNDISFTAQQTASLQDNLDDGSSDSALIVDAGGLLTIQGNSLVRLEADNNPGSSVLRSGGDLMLRSDGVIVANGTLDAGGDLLLLTLAGTPNGFTSTSTDTLISSNGNVVFGDYTGLALKVEAQGSIQGGTITIVGPNPALAGSDSDIPLLNSRSALILRAGNSPQNPPNIPASGVGGTTFSETAPAAPGNIEVGDINTSVIVGEGGPVILTATGQIVTGDIDTSTDQLDDDDLSPPYIAGGDVTVSAIESVTLGSVSTDGGQILVNGSEIKTDRLSAYSFFSNFSDEPTEGQVTLVSTEGDIEVGSIRAGAGGVSIDAAERFRAVGDTVDFRLNTNGGIGTVEAVVKLKDSLEVIDYLVAQGFERSELEASEATVSIFNAQAVPASIVAYSGDSVNSSISIRHGGVDLPDSDDIVVDGGGSDYEFAIGPASGPGFEGDLMGFDPLDADAEITLYRTGNSTVYETIPTSISGTVGALIVGNDINNGQVYSAFLNRPLPPEVDPPVVDPPVVDPPVVEEPEIEDPSTDGETLVAADDPDVEIADDSSLCSPDEEPSDLIAARSGEERSGEADPCVVPAADTILQIEEDIDL